MTRAARETLTKIGEEELASEFFRIPRLIFMNNLRSYRPAIQIQHIVGAYKRRVECHSKQLLRRERETIAVFEDYHDIPIDTEFAG